MGDSPRVTVFTATFNRADRLGRAYQSLQSQTCRDFEWRIVDDGSTDDTEALVSDWQRESTFPIHYSWQPNQGKHIAHNAGAAWAPGEYFVSLDSDDGLLSNAIEVLLAAWEAIPVADQSKFSSVVGLCRDQHGNLIGTGIPNAPLDSDPWELRLKWRVQGDKLAMHRTSVIKEFPFPDNLKGPFYPEDLIWFEMGRRYKSRYLNDVVLEVFVEPESISRGNPRRLSDQNRALAKYELERGVQEGLITDKRVLRASANYVRFSRHSSLSSRSLLGELSGRARALAIVALPLGTFLFARDVKRYPKA